MSGKKKNLFSNQSQGVVAFITNEDINSLNAAKNITRFLLFLILSFLETDHTKHLVQLCFCAISLSQK